MPVTSPSAPVTKLVELDLSGLSAEAKQRAKNEAGRILVEEIQAHLDRSSSPVSGGSFKKKKVDGTNSILLEFGDLRDSIEFRRRRGNLIEVGVFSSSQRAKAYGHNTGFEGHPHLDNPSNTRKFIPTDSESFKRTIQGRINQQIKDIREFDQARKEAESSQIGVGDLAEAAQASTAVQSQTAATLNLGALFAGEDLFGEG